MGVLSILWEQKVEFKILFLTFSFPFLQVICEHHDVVMKWWKLFALKPLDY